MRFSITTFIYTYLHLYIFCTEVYTYLHLYTFWHFHQGTHFSSHLYLFTDVKRVLRTTFCRCGAGRRQKVIYPCIILKDWHQRRYHKSAISLSSEYRMVRTTRRNRMIPTRKKKNRSPRKSWRGWGASWVEKFAGRKCRQCQKTQTSSTSTRSRRRTFWIWCTSLKSERK